MCRMIAYVGKGDAGLPRLFSAFREGSKCDPYVAPALGPEYTCHPNGWGYAIYDGLNLHHFRSSRPVWEEEVQLPAVAGQTVYAIFHSRLASDPRLKSPISSHPFIAPTDEAILLLAHNGGVEEDEPAVKGVVDSEWALGVIAKAGSLKKALPLLKERTRRNSALNLIVLAIPRNQAAPPEVHCLNYFKTEDAGRKAYYTMYRAEAGNGEVFFSSTFKPLGLSGLGRIQEAPFGQLFSLGLPAW